MTVKMEGFDSDPPPRRKWRSSVSDENDLAYCGTGAWKTAARPSELGKITPPAKKVLGERNGSRDVDGGFRTLRLCQSPSKVSESREGVFGPSPSDTSKNFHVPRPEFLRYRPDWRSKVLTRMQDGEEITGKRNSGQYFFDEEGSNSHGETEDEVEEGEEEEEEEEGEEEEEEEEEGEEEEEKEGDVGRRDGRKGLIKKLAWFALFLLSVSCLYPIDINEVPAQAERINSYLGEVSSWPVHNLTHQPASENISPGMNSLTGEREPDYDNEVILSKIEEEILPTFGDDHRPQEFEELSGSVIWDSGFADDTAGKDSLTGEHSVLSAERDLGCGNEAIFSTIEEEMWPNFGDDYQPLEFKELSGSLIWDSGFVDDSQENAAVVNKEEVQQSSERGRELSELEKFYSPPTLNLHVDLGKIMEEKHLSSEKHEIPEDQAWKIARVHIIVVLSLSILFLIATTLLLGIFVKRRSSSNTFQLQATEEELYKGQPIVHSSSSTELQSPTARRASVDTDSAFYPKHNPAPCVQLLGEITFGEHNRSHESITVTKSQLKEQSRGLLSPEKKLSHKELWESTFTVKSPTDGSTSRKQEATPSHKCRLFHCNCSGRESKISADKGINGSSLATPTPLRRSSRIRNRVVQSP